MSFKHQYRIIILYTFYNCFSQQMRGNLNMANYSKLLPLKSHSIELSYLK